MELAIHITFDRRGRGPLHLAHASWDETIFRVLRVLSSWNLVAACVVHDHLHVVLLIGREAAGRAAQAIECALGWALRPDESDAGTWWNPPRYTIIRDARHLTDTVAYILRNGVISLDAPMLLLLWRWSTAWDALGLRYTGFELCRDVPDTSRSATAMTVFGDRKWQPTPAAILTEPLEPVTFLVQIARLATGFGLQRPFGQDDVSLATRSVVIALARTRGWSGTSIAAALAVSPRTVHRTLALEAEDPRLVAARCLLHEIALLGPILLEPPGPGRLHGRR